MHVTLIRVSYNVFVFYQTIMPYEFNGCLAEGCFSMPNLHIHVLLAKASRETTGDKMSLHLISYFSNYDRNNEISQFSVWWSRVAERCQMGKLTGCGKIVNRDFRMGTHAFWPLDRHWPRETLDGLLTFRPAVACLWEFVCMLNDQTLLPASVCKVTTNSVPYALLTCTLLIVNSHLAGLVRKCKSLPQRVVFPVGSTVGGWKEYSQISPSALCDPDAEWSFPWENWACWPNTFDVDHLIRELIQLFNLQF